MCSCSESGTFVMCYPCYVDYYNAARTHLALSKDTPIQRAVQSAGRIQARPVLGGLHHQYARI